MTITSFIAAQLPDDVPSYPTFAARLLNIASVVRRDTQSIAAVTNVLATHAGIAECAVAQTAFNIPNNRRDWTDHIARRAQCATRGHKERSEVYDLDQAQYLFTCQV